MSVTYRFEIFPTSHRTKLVSSHENDLKQWFLKYKNVQLNNIYEVKYFLVSLPSPVSDLGIIAKAVFTDEVIEELNSNDNVKIDLSSFLSERQFRKSENIKSIDVSFKVGVTDNSAHAALEALKLFPKLCDLDITVSSGSYYLIESKEPLSSSMLEELAFEKIANSLLHKVHIENYEQMIKNARFENLHIPEIKSANVPSLLINLDVDDKTLLDMNTKNCWALSLSELLYIKDHYKKLNRQPTDVEIEVIAQSWSEHCKHKIFASHIEYTESNLPLGARALHSMSIEGLFKTFIRGSTLKIKEDRNLPWLISIFHDNAGIVRFDKNVDVCIKVETHNSPSALDPYGGALTGILGVNRDILGVGIGAKPIANTNVFCLAEDSFFKKHNISIPKKIKNPDRIKEGVHLGVQDGGNKSGIPTVNGAFSFDYDFVGKPLVFCGTIGVLPQIENNIDTSLKRQKPGDLIVMSGGRIGKDGIHGATFSSMELNDFVPSSVVQIGDPITQKRLGDFLIEARKLGLFSSVTDNGAGGLSSSIGEMSQGTNGAIVNLECAPTKYPGLSPFELMVSESQERMTFAVPVESIDAFLSLSKRRSVESTVVGEFTSSGYLDIRFHGKQVGHISLHFLHESLLPMNLKAHFDLNGVNHSMSSHWFKQKNITIDKSKPTKDLNQYILQLLSSPNIRSHEHMVRRYDHEVKAATIVKPYTGQDEVGYFGPTDAGVVWLYPHGGEKDSAISISCGLAPKVSRFDAYEMSVYAIDEAVRNSICVGADPEMMVLVDNYCWPDPITSLKNPDAEYKLAQLVRASKAIFDMSCDYGMPFVSGKDSMKNDFVVEDIKISVPPTLLITAMGKVQSLNHVVTSEIKNSGECLYLVGEHFLNHSSAFHLSEIYDDLDVTFPLPTIDFKKQIALYKKIHHAIKESLVTSAHDVSEGGVAISLTEMIMSTKFGISLDLDFLKADQVERFLFNEGPGRIVISVKSHNVSKFESILGQENVTKIGATNDSGLLCIKHLSKEIVEIKNTNTLNAYRVEAQDHI